MAPPDKAEELDEFELLVTFGWVVPVAEVEILDTVVDGHL